MPSEAGPPAAEERRVLRRRIFFALWPDEATRRALLRASRQAVRRSGGKATPVDNLHITLAFIGPVTEDDLQRVQGFTPPASAPFELCFDTLGYWPRSSVLWAAPSRLPTEIVTLEAALWDQLVSLGFEREPRPYRPHVTLARKARVASEGLVPVTWPVTGFVLVESRPAARHSVYEQLEAWPLGPMTRRD